MSHGRPPSFQFYPADYLADFECRQLTFDQRGRYIDLLCLSWLSATPGIMSDDEARAMLSYSAVEWDSVRTAFVGHVLKEDHSHSERTLSQSRMISERQKQARRYAQARKGAEVTNGRRGNYVAQRSDSVRSAVAPSSSSTEEPRNEPIFSVPRNVEPNGDVVRFPDRIELTDNAKASERIVEAERQVRALREVAS